MILILMVLFLILDDPSPLDRDYFVIVFLLVAPLEAENIALLAETEDNAFGSDCK